MKPGIIVGPRGALGTFPLGKTGGLIEASRPSRFPLAVLPGFRWVKPAASLKPGRCRS